MSWEMAVGAAAGELMGGLLQRGSDGIDVSENVRLNRAMGDLQIEYGPKLTDAYVGGVTSAAKKYGYHPMYLMGSGQNYSPTVVAGHGASGGPDYAGIGSRLGQAAGEYFTEGKRKQTQSEKAMGLRMQNAQVRNAELDAELKYTEIMRMKQELNGRRNTGGNPEDGGAQTFGARPPPIPVRYTADGKKQIKHIDGKWRTVKNPGIVRAGEDDYEEGMTIEAMIEWINGPGTEMFQDFFKDYSSKVGPRAAIKMLWDFLRPGWDKQR